MALHAQKSQGTVPPRLSATGQPLPRRSSPEKSVTLNHHRLARDASLRASPGSTPNKTNTTDSPRRNSSGESHETGQSDPIKWFDQSNENPTATFDHATMDVDPPFFQKESDSSNEDRPYTYQNPQPQPRLATGHSSSADDYRSVIDDLTVEIQKLREELKKHKQRGPDMLRKDQLFEIKYHGLPKRKRRELETTLRDFAASVEGSPGVSAPRQKKSLRQSNRDHMYSGSAAASKHASSSSGSNTRPIDSAYASMSSGANSSGVSLGRPAANSRAKNAQKVESYLRDIPEGLYPRHMILTDRERKKLVVRRLEQIFTGKFGGRHARPARQGLNVPGLLAPGVDPEVQPKFLKEQEQSTGPSGLEPSREAKILSQDQQLGTFEKKNPSGDNVSTLNSNGDQTESGGNGNSSRSGTNASPTQPPAVDQRPTKVKDLDPDRVQVPSENMEYIRHLGLVPPELLSSSDNDVQPDADGWVYLNLLCSLAQLHIVNVTPSFVRSAVSDISTKFQLSPDGRKIRWRGGSEGTRFSSDSSNDSSQTTPDLGDVDQANMGSSCKRQKTGNSSGYEIQSGGSSKSRSKFGPQVSTSSDSFHYKPLFAHTNSPNGETSMDDTLSSFGPIEDSNIDESREGLSGSGMSNRRKRRHDGAIIFYSGAPFCTDLSGDPSDASPAAYLSSCEQDRQEQDWTLNRPMVHRSASGSSLSYRPLSEWKHNHESDSKMDVDNFEDVPELASDSDSEECGTPDPEFPWSTGQQYIEVLPLEPCGLGGVMPDDHFMVVVTTKRHKDEAPSEQRSTTRRKSEEASELIIGRLASMSTSSPVPMSSTQQSVPVEINYVSGRIKRLAPVSLPPPVIFLPPFSSDSSSVNDDDSELSDEQGDGDVESSVELMSRQANPHQSDGYPDGVDLSSGDEDGEEPDEDSEGLKMYDQMDTDVNMGFKNDGKRESIGSAEAVPGSLRRGESASADPMMSRTGASSAATAGEVRSRCSSSDEEN